MNHLEFEQPIVDLEAKINELQRLSQDEEKHINIDNEITRLSKKCEKLKESIFSSLTPWQIAQLARHPQRPYTLDYIKAFITNFEELKGDRQHSDDQSIITGIGFFSDQAVAIVGNQKGRTTQDKVQRNFGMPRPEGYRKAQRIFKLAEQFGLPILTFIDTPGAYPGIEAEERGQSRAIAENIQLMSRLKVPIISTIIGEGGSGGALAIGVCDSLLMLEFSTYSVISPEGCASILWKKTEKAEIAAQALNIVASNLEKMGLIDEIISEPLGGAHRDYEMICIALRRVLSRHLEDLTRMDTQTLVERRYEKLTNVGSIDTWIQD